MDTDYDPFSRIIRCVAIRLLHLPIMSRRVESREQETAVAPPIFSLQPVLTYER